LSLVLLVWERNVLSLVLLVWERNTCFLPNWNCVYYYYYYYYYYYGSEIAQSV
jgi:hypothetical protein